MRVAIVFGNDGSDVRLGKTCRALAKFGHDVHFVGWDRRPQTQKCIDLPGVQRHVVAIGTPFARTTLRAQLRFSWHVVRTLARIRPDVVCAVNEDNAVRVLPFKRLLYRRLVCDVYDSHQDRASARPFATRAALNLLSEWARWGADALIVTDDDRFSRLGRHRWKCTVVGNYPEDPGPGLARRAVGGPTRICVCGTLAETRGIRQLLAAVERSSDAVIVAAGWPNDDFADREFVRHPRVEFHGVVSPLRALELASGCDAVFAFYAPNCLNNIFASPNKVYDAMSVGRPVMINSEAKISDWIVRQSLGFACRYDDQHRLRQIVDSLSGLRSAMPAAAARRRGMFAARFTWEKMERRLATIYGDCRDRPHARLLEAVAA
jgi:glycosyltransferase involved in cell wall biosynthesis